MTGPLARSRRSRPVISTFPSSVNCLRRTFLGDNRTPADKAMFGMLSVFGEYEPSMIVERVKAMSRGREARESALAVVRLAAIIIERIRSQLPSGAGILKTAKLIGCGVGTVHRIK